jgi:hypothetical protein
MSFFSTGWSALFGMGLVVCVVLVLIREFGMGPEPELAESSLGPEFAKQNYENKLNTYKKEKRDYLISSCVFGGVAVLAVVGYFIDSRYFTTKPPAT